MGRKNLVILLSFFFIFTSCKNYYHDSLIGGYRPKKPKFSEELKSSLSNSQGLIDANSIYISSDTLIYGEGKYKSNFFMKFYKDGRIFRSSIDAKISIHNQELSPTFVGYYNVCKNEVVEIETFYVKHKERGNYIKSYGLVLNDTIFMYKSPIKKDSFPSPNKNNSITYIRKSIINDYSPEPNW